MLLEASRQTNLAAKLN